MIYLLLSLLVFGLIQSLLELIKDSEKPYKKTVQKILAAVYILGFIAGVTITIRQERESSDYNKLIGGISVSVTKIDSKFPEVLQKLSKSLDETKTLIASSDSMNKSMVSLIKIRDSLSVQTKLINDKLSKQLEIDQLALKEKAPEIVLMTNDIALDSNNLVAPRLEVKIKNYGKRNALIKRGSGYVVFFNIQNKPFAFVEIPGYYIPSILAPFETSSMFSQYNTYPIKDFNSLKAKTYFAIICLKIKYQDILSQSEQTQFFYTGWLPQREEFGDLQNWKTELAKKWAKENKILE